jgi:anti-sigma factor RsiW
VTCSSSEALFEAYLGGTLIATQRARLLRHVNRCGRCKGVLEELRVVEALLASCTAPQLSANFTFATMAEVRSLPQPRAAAVTPIAAYLAAYLSTAWLVIGVGFLFAWPAMRALGDAAFDVSAQFGRTVVAFADPGARLIADLGAASLAVGGVAVADVVLLVTLITGIAIVRPRVTNRLRP